MPTNLDNDKEELKLKSQLINALQVFDLLPHEQDSKYGSGKANKEDYWRICNKAIDQYTQSKLKAFAGEVMEAIGEDEKGFTKRSRPYEDSDTDKLWDLANGIEPISSGQISTWGGSATTQFRKFALKLRNTIWKEAELHNNELRDELRQALKAIKEKAGIE